MGGRPAGCSGVCVDGSSGGLYRIYAAGGRTFGWVARRFPSGARVSAWVAHARGARYELAGEAPQLAVAAARAALEATATARLPSAALILFSAAVANGWSLKLEPMECSTMWIAILASLIWN